MKHRISEIKDRLEKATPGPWEADICETGSGVVSDEGWICQLWYKTEEPMENHICNADFIAHAPEDIRFLLDEIDRLQIENKPLTLDEMNHLDHELIYIKHVNGNRSLDGWHIATSSSYTNHGVCDLELDNGNQIIDMNNYGKTWLAYRYKPDEVKELRGENQRLREALEEIMEQADLFGHMTYFEIARRALEGESE